jgi:hypothetical protein
MDYFQTLYKFVLQNALHSLLLTSHGQFIDANDVFPLLTIVGADMVEKV